MPKQLRALRRELGVFIAALGAAVLVSLSLQTLAMFVEGETYGSNRVEVTQESPAKAAGLIDGDRIVQVDGISTADFAAVREIVHRNAATHTLRIERDGHHLDIAVTPNAKGTIGIVGITEFRKVTFWQACVGGGSMALQFWRRVLIPSGEKVEMVGPVAVVRATSRDRGASYLRLIALLQCSLCLAIPAAFANDWLMWGLFKMKRSRVIPADPHIARMQRLHHALWANVIGLVSGLVLSASTDLTILTQSTPRLSIYDPYQAWFAFFKFGLPVIVWLICKELYGPKKAVGIASLLVVPVVNVLVVLWHANAASRWLKNRIAAPGGAPQPANG